MPRLRGCFLLATLNQRARTLVSSEAGGGWKAEVFGTSNPDLQPSDFSLRIAPIALFQRSMIGLFSGSGKHMMHDRIFREDVFWP